MFIQLYCESQATLYNAKNPIFNVLFTHIDVDCHFIYNEIVRHNLQLSYVPTHAQLWVALDFISYLTSWTFRVYMHQLEGGDNRKQNTFHQVY